MIKDKKQKFENIVQISTKNMAQHFIFYQKYIQVKIKEYFYINYSKIMPRQQSLQSMTPNRFYQINATLKYQNIGQNNITGIIEQDNVQSKICIPKHGSELVEGQQYTFGKCFNSRNGWLYAKNPSQTIASKQSSSNNNSMFLNLKQIYQNKDSLLNHYISTDLKVIEIQPKQTISKNGSQLILYKMKCFSDDLLVEIIIWNKEIKENDIKGKIINLIGFKIKALTHQTFNLVSAVYSKIQLSNNQEQDSRFNYQFNVLYKNVSNIYDIRNIDTIQKACEVSHKNYSICQAQISNIQKLFYEGCNICKKKLYENGCYQCGSKVTKVLYSYLRVILEDNSGVIECAVFSQDMQLLIQRAYGNGKAIFRIKSAAKRNHQTNQFYSSHVVTQIKEFVCKS